MLSTKNRVIFKDTFLDIFEGKISYLVFAFTLLGFIFTLSIGKSAKNFAETSSFGYKDFFIFSAFYFFTFLFKSIIFLFISSFILSKHSYFKKLSFLFYPVKRKEYIIILVFATITYSFIFFLLWDIVSYFLQYCLFHSNVKYYFLYFLLSDISIFLYSPLVLFIGLYFSEISTAFLSVIIFLGSSFSLLLMPYFNIEIPEEIMIIINNIPSLFNFIIFIPIKVMNIPNGLIDLKPRIWDIAFYIFLFIVFLILSIKNIKRIEDDIP